MTWIIFDEADHFQPAPHFCLTSQQGERVCLRDYHEDCQLVVIFPGDSPNGQQILEAFAERVDAYRSYDARILVVSGNSRAYGELTAGSLLVLSDLENKTRRAYAGLMDESLVREGDWMVFVLDLYSAPYAAWVGADPAGSDFHQQVQSWLAYIGIQCPE